MNGGLSKICLIHTYVCCEPDYFILNGIVNDLRDMNEIRKNIYCNDSIRLMNTSPGSKVLVIADRELFFSIPTGDRYLVKRSLDDRDRKNAIFF